MKKTETVAEFIARGGKITRVPPRDHTAKIESIKSSNANGPAVLLTMDEADLYYGEHKQKKVKKKSSAGRDVIDLSALPEELRKKYIDGVINGQDEDADEEDDEQQ
jgi:hypothetical protein